MICDFMFKLQSGLIVNGLSIRSEKAVRMLLLDMKRKYGVGWASASTVVISRLRPSVLLRVRTKAGISHRVPYLLRGLQADSYAVRWFRAGIKRRDERNFFERVRLEWLSLDSVGQLRQRTVNVGYSGRNRDLVHSTALLNRGMISLFWGRRKLVLCKLFCDVGAIE